MAEESERVMATVEQATLEDAIEIAVAAHRGQTDKAGQPYVLHPLRLIAQMRTEPEQIAAATRSLMAALGKRRCHVVHKATVHGRASAMGE